MRIPIAAAALLLAPAAVFAGGYAVPNTNSRDEGMAGSAVANQNGPEAAFANGAALAGTEGLMISASGTGIWFNSTWTGTAGNLSSSTNGPPATPPNLNVSYGLKPGGMPLAFGLAFAVPGGGQVQWDDAWAGRAAITLVDRRIYSLDIVGAIQPIEMLKLSLGGAYFYGTEHLKQKLVFGGIPDGTAELGTSGGQWSFTAAAELKPLKDVPFKIGLQYKHKADMKLSGSAHFSGVPASLQPAPPIGGALIDQSATHNLTFPNVLNAGVSYEVIKDLTLQAAVTFMRFIVYKDDYFIGSKSLTIHLPFNYTNAMTYRAGGEYGLPMVPGLKVRLGLLRDVTPQPTSTVSPGLPTGSNWALSMGAGYDITPSLTANLAFEHAWFDGITVDPNSEAFQGSYSTNATLLSVGLVYRMK